MRVAPARGADMDVRPVRLEEVIERDGCHGRVQRVQLSNCEISGFVFGANRQEPFTPGHLARQRPLDVDERGSCAAWYPSGRRCFLIAPLRDAAQVKEVSTLGFFVLERRSLLAGVTGNRDLG